MVTANVRLFILCKSLLKVCFIVLFVCKTYGIALCRALYPWLCFPMKWPVLWSVILFFLIFVRFFNIASWLFSCSFIHVFQ